MTVARLAVSFDEDLARAVRRAARGEATSAWLADAARRKLRSEGLRRVVREWEAGNGELREDELVIAEKGLRRRGRK